MDELTRLTLRVIELENQKPVKELEKRVKSLELAQAALSGILERLKVLEEARLRQIQLNASFITKGAEAVKPKSWLDYFKK